MCKVTYQRITLGGTPANWKLTWRQYRRLVCGLSVVQAKEQNSYGIAGAI